MEEQIKQILDDSKISYGERNEATIHLSEFNWLIELARKVNQYEKTLIEIKQIVGTSQSNENQALHEIGSIVQGF